MRRRRRPRGGGGGEVRQEEFKKSKLIVAQPCGARLKSHLMPSPPPLRDIKNPCMVKRRGACQARQSKVTVTTQGKALVTSALYLKRTSHY